MTIDEYGKLLTDAYARADAMANEALERSRTSSPDGKAANYAFAFGSLQVRLSTALVEAVRLRAEIDRLKARLEDRDAIHA